VTVINIDNGSVRYASIKSVIKQRTVNEQTIALYEALGICFGRKPEPYRESWQEVSGRPWSHI
jgi:6-phosphofructokinase 1